MNFICYADLIRDVRAFSAKLPHFDLIAGVARSGILPALLLSLERNVGFGIFDGELKVIKAGRNKALSRDSVLVLDDSVCSGMTMARVRNVLGNSVSYGCVYTANPASTDHAFRYVAMPRVFEWNLFHHDQNVNMAFDLDGVFCPDPDAGIDLDRHDRDALCLVVPSYGIGAIITARTEDRRAITEAWLKHSGIEYRELIMRPDKGVDVAKYKAYHYGNSRYLLYVEDQAALARQIAQLSEKPVLSLTEMKLV